MPERPVTSRGFAVYAELTDRYGNKVRVQKSSLATADCVWIFASHPAPKLTEVWRRRLARAGFATDVQLDELAAFLTPSPHLDVEQARQVRDALDALIREHSEPLTVASVDPGDAEAFGMVIDQLADPAQRMAITPDGVVKPVSEFAAEEKWWCDGEDCNGSTTVDGPHVHPGWGLPTLRVDLLTGKNEHHPEYGKQDDGGEARDA